MTCPNAENLTAFADGELGPDELAAVDQHLGGCPACAEFVSDMRRLGALGRTSLQQIRVASPPPLPRIKLRPYRHVRLAGAIAAAVVLATAGAAWLMTSVRRPPVTHTAPSPRSPQVTAVATTTAVTFSDEQFEQWAAPHRQRRIPLVPMEQVETYKPPPVLPFVPIEARSNERVQ